MTATRPARRSRLPLLAAGVVVITVAVCASTGVAEPSPSPEALRPPTHDFGVISSMDPGKPMSYGAIPLCRERGSAPVTVTGVRFTSPDIPARITHFAVAPAGKHAVGALPGTLPQLGVTTGPSTITSSCASEDDTSGSGTYMLMITAEMTQDRVGESTLTLDYDDGEGRSRTQLIPFHLQVCPPSDRSECSPDTSGSEPSTTTS